MKYYTKQCKCHKPFVTQFRNREKCPECLRQRIGLNKVIEKTVKQ